MVRIPREAQRQIFLAGSGITGIMSAMFFFGDSDEARQRLTINTSRTTETKAQFSAKETAHDGKIERSASTGRYRMISPACHFTANLLGDRTRNGKREELSESGETPIY